MQRVLSFPPQERQSPGEFITKRLCCSFLLTVAFLAMLSGYLLGRYTPKRYKRDSCKFEFADQVKIHNAVGGSLENKILAENLRQFHRKLQEPNILSKENEEISLNLQQAILLQKHFESNGFDMTSDPLPVQVLLSFYQHVEPNKVSLINDRSKEDFTANALFTKININNPNQSKVKNIVQEEVVYANFGREEDFIYLNQIPVSVQKRIVLLRIKYKTTVFDVVSRALDAGAAAIILFADPLYLSDSTHFLNPAQLGRLQARCHEKEQNHQLESCVAVVQISSNDAENILNEVSDQYKSPQTWRGKQHSDYNIGPGLKRAGWKLRVEVNIINIIHTYYNVIAAIRGSKEPDRYVLLGSSRKLLMKPDSDHLGSTACMMELARVLGQLRSRWVPRRSVVFCNWGLQGDGHFNSEIWAKQYTNLLRERAVAYISMESAVAGNESLSVEAVPLLQQAVREASALVPNPNGKEYSAGFKTIFDSWRKYSSVHFNSTPKVANIQGEGDYQMFLHEQGVPSLDFGYTGSQLFVDNNFTVHRAMTELWSLLLWTLADSIILPFQPNDYAIFVKESLDTINKTHHINLSKHNISTESLEKAVKEFSAVSEEFTTQLKDLNKANSLKIRVMNDKIVHLERTLLCTPTYKRHKVLWEGVTNYTGFGQLHKEIKELQYHGDTSAVVEHISLLTSCLNSANLLLKDSVLVFTNK